jgi:hypothetical protein
MDVIAQNSRVGFGWKTAWHPAQGDLVDVKHKGVTRRYRVTSVRPAERFGEYSYELELTPAQ